MIRIYIASLLLVISASCRSQKEVQLRSSTFTTSERLSSETQDSLTSIIDSFYSKMNVDLSDVVIEVSPPDSAYKSPFLSPKKVSIGHIRFHRADSNIRTQTTEKHTISSDSSVSLSDFASTMYSRSETKAPSPLNWGMSLILPLSLLLTLILAVKYFRNR